MDASDRPRYSARAIGYTTNVAAAVDKLECVNEEEQPRQSTQARRRDLASLKAKSAPHRDDTILRELEAFAGIGALTSTLRRDVGTVTRLTRRVDKQLDELDPEFQ